MIHNNYHSMAPVLYNMMLSEEELMFVVRVRAYMCCYNQDVTKIMSINYLHLLVSSDGQQLACTPWLRVHAEQVRCLPPVSRSGFHMAFKSRIWLDSIWVWDSDWRMLLISSFRTHLVWTKYRVASLPILLLKLCRYQENGTQICLLYPYLWLNQHTRRTLKSMI